ncbi:DUF3618 domain-containing protein [Streptomyces orinoci]|uniref:DUF3618 domain-containing protein n=1 Tax=Streptomyces orinoci TaxID=67339 RepID=A0ABV3JR40_STRON|nr:DUF3618 domain-containing protein [Streptomyces orinoci]
MPEARTPAQIEADIARRRGELAVTLDEIGVRLHPSTIIGDAKAKVTSKVDQTAGRACATAGRIAAEVRAQFVTDEGVPRLERIIPAAMLAVGVVGLLTVARRRRS